MKLRKAPKLNKQFFLHNGEILLRKQIFYLKGKASGIRIFSAGELEKATTNYHHSQLVGCGRFGCMYKGLLDDREIAVKTRIGSSIESLMTEVVFHSNINHRNVAKLLGCCLETQVPILVYEFISNGSLSNYIHQHRNNETPLPWRDCLRIATEIADAVTYLHCYSSNAIVHRDIKSSNILLDKHFTVKLISFGLLVPIPIGKMHAELEVEGSYGYIDPEYIATGQLKGKSDVYSFGMVLLELLTGKGPNFECKDDRSLVEHISSAMSEGSLAQFLEASIVKDGKMEQLQAFAEVAKKCLHVKGEERPTMKAVVQELRQIRRLGP